ncbi:MAG: hypothetical protein CM15mV11_0920 [Caudoviricetes sp.]|nr:MAG: hypothetical protein CM15mV11_0920 [Caudoviricetes sp.]
MRPYIESDGGYLEYIGIDYLKEGAIVMVRMGGACSGCAMSAQTLQLGIERRVKEVFPEVTGISSMSIKQEIYLGNPNLKKANVSTQFTKKQVAEYMKCAQDPVYFIRTYIRIVSLDEGVIPFDMYDFQESMVRSFINIDLILQNYLVSLVSLLLLQHIYYGMFSLMLM